MGGPVTGISPLNQVNSVTETGKLGQEGSDFFSQLQTAFHEVGQLQTQADQQISGLISGQGGDIHRAMIAVEKANLSFELMMQVRNKIIQAYRDVSSTNF
jgi:flagellar hook-basal body complex protein FliE